MKQIWFRIIVVLTTVTVWGIALYLEDNLFIPEVYTPDITILFKFLITSIIYSSLIIGSYVILAYCIRLIKYYMFTS